MSKTAERKRTSKKNPWIANLWTVLLTVLWLAAVLIYPVAAQLEKALVSLVLGAIFLFIPLFYLIFFFFIWLSAFLHEAPVSFVNLVTMHFRGVPIDLIVQARITAHRAGIELGTDELESHYRAQGNLLPTVRAMIAAHEANVNLSWEQACANELDDSWCHLE